MKRVLVTGATGFIGRHSLPLLLARGYEVRGVSRGSVGVSRGFGGDTDGSLRGPVGEPDSSFGEVDRDVVYEEVIWHQCDLLNVDAVSSLVADVQPTHLLHFAWITEPGVYWASPENEQWKQASLQLLSAFRDNGGQRVVMAGTCAEYDWQDGGHLQEGVTPLHPRTLYGTCKHELQQELEAFSRERALSSAWGRIFYLYGPFEHPNRLVSSVITSLLQGNPVRCTHGEQIRDFLYVKDVADAFVTLLEQRDQGPFNIASGSPRPIKDIIQTIARTLGREDLIAWGALPAAKEDPPTLTADIERLHQELQWKPKYSLEAGIEESILWWKDHLPQLTHLSS